MEYRIKPSLRKEHNPSLIHQLSHDIVHHIHKPYILLSEDKEMNKLIKILPAFMVIALILSSCAQATQAPAPAATQMPATQAPATQVPTAVPPTATTAPKVALTYWDNMSSDSTTFQDKLISEFEAAHPNITITHVNMSLNDLQVKLPVAMSSGVGPDLVEADVSPQWLGTYVKTGEVYPLDDAYTQYGWDKSVFQWAQVRVTYQGKRYAVGHEFETLGLMYNKKIFTDLKLQVPQTLEDLETVMDAIKKDGHYTPMMLAAGSASPWNTIHMINAIGYGQIPMDVVNATTPIGTGSYLDPAWKATLVKFQSWVQKGYFPTNASSYDWDTQNSLFCSGKVAMLTQGTWDFGAIVDCAKTSNLDWGYAPFPVPAGKPFQAYIGIGSGFYVPNYVAKDPATLKATLDFLDFLISPAVATRWVTEAKLFPAVPFDQTAANLSEQQLAALAIVTKAGATGGGPIAICFNNSGDELTLWQSGLEGIVAGKTNIDTFLTQLDTQLKKDQAAWLAK
jgi:raffinose/stachyose/melibiose transport system substrate-binding protein